MLAEDTIDRVTSAVVDLASPHVVVVSRDPALADDVRRALAPGAVVTSVVYADDLDALHLDLTSSGRSDVILDVCGEPRLAARFRRSVPHLRVGGRLLMTVPAEPTGRRAVRAWVRKLRLAQADPELQAPGARRDPRPRKVRDLHACASSITEVVLDDRLLMVTGVGEALARVDETEMNAFLERRHDVGRVLAIEPPTTWRRTGAFVSTAPDEKGWESLACPELSLREYADVVCEPRMAAHTHGILLPDSLRDPFTTRGTSPVVRDWSPGFARTVGGPPTEHLDGHWFYLDNILRGHFGHAFTEQLGHLWGWAEALRLRPDLRLLMLGGPHVAAWELDLLEAAGVPRDRVHAVEGPVTVERLVASTPAYVISAYVHPAMRPLYRRIGESLRGRGEGEPGPRRVFVTRTDDKRVCRNRSEVEELFAQHGFEIVSPERFSLPEQSQLLARAEVVAGFGGSGLFPLVTAPHVQRVLVISSDTYHVANEKMLGGFVGADVTVIRCRAETVTERFSAAMFHSAYTVDWGREGRALRDALADLDASG